MKQTQRQRRLASQQSLDDLRSLTWPQFEEVVADAYRRKGFRVAEVGGQGDGGIDLVLHGPSGTTHPVQCKRWRTWKVGAPQIREFVGAMASMAEATSGVYVACGTYTTGAVDLARRHNLELVDGLMLLNLIGNHSRPRVSEQEVRPICPRCGGLMVIRTAQRGSNIGSQFWGCSSFPTCRGTRPLNPR